MDEIYDGLFGACLELALTPEETIAFADDYLDTFAQAKCETDAGTAYGDRIYLNVVSAADTEKTWPKDDEAADDPEGTDDPEKDPDPGEGESDMKVASKSYSFHATGSGSLAEYGDTYKWIYQSSLTEDKQDPEMTIAFPTEATPVSIPLSLTEAEKASAKELIRLLEDKKVLSVKTHYSVKTNFPVTVILATLAAGQVGRADDIKPLPYLTTLGEAAGSAWSLSKTIDYNKFSSYNIFSEVPDFPFSVDNDKYSTAVRILGVLFLLHCAFYKQPDYDKLAKAIDMPDEILEKAEAAIQAKDETAFAEALSEYEATPAGQRLAAAADDFINQNNGLVEVDLIGFIAAIDKTDSATFRFAESPVRLLPNGSNLSNKPLWQMAEMTVYVLSMMTSDYQNGGRTQPFVDVSVSERGMQLDGLGYSFVYACMTLFARYGTGLPADFEVDLSVDVSYLEGK